MWRCVQMMSHQTAAVKLHSNCKWSGTAQHCCHTALDWHSHSIRQGIVFFFFLCGALKSSDRYMLKITPLGGDPLNLRPPSGQVDHFHLQLWCCSKLALGFNTAGEVTRTDPRPAVRRAEGPNSFHWKKREVRSFILLHKISRTACCFGICTFLKWYNCYESATIWYTDHQYLAQYSEIINNLQGIPLIFCNYAVRSCGTWRKGRQSSCNVLSISDLEL